MFFIILIGVFLAGFICATSSAVYNLWLHPLSKVPGPLLARCSLLWRCWNSMSGRYHRAIEEQHRKHGPIFRVSPNELSFASADSWKAIYGAPLAGQKHCIKSEFYDVFAAGYDSKCIGSERNPSAHAQMKKNLSAAFSTKALLDQEQVIRSCVDEMIAKVRTKGNSLHGLNMTHWFEMVAFDILGAMAFGESFHSIEKEAPHFWFEMLTKYLFFITLVDNLRRLPFVPTIGKLIAPLTAGIQERNHRYSRDLVQRRLRRGSDLKDFVTNVVSKVKDGSVSVEELTAHSATLIVAGGETISTFLASTTFYLCKNPRCLDKLQADLRQAFPSLAEITAGAAGQVPYLQAVIQEGLRIFPPGSQGFPRLSPGVEIDGLWVPPKTEIYTSPWTVTHDEKYFKDPYSFRPERWIDRDSEDVKEASQPFSLGPRGCIGRNFAMVEASLILATLLFEFDIELVNPNQEWESQCRMHINWLKPDMPPAIPASQAPHPLNMAQIKPTREGPSLHGKTVLITGASSGIGLAASKIFASKGAHVFNLDINPPEGGVPIGIDFVECDQSSWPQLLDAFDHAGSVDIAVANGGVSEYANYFEDSFDKDGKLELPSQDVFDVNLKGSCNFCKLALSRMREQGRGGSIVVVASATGLAPEHSLPLYSACKAAMLGLVRVLRSVTPRHNISINAVAPAATISNQLPKHLAAPIIDAGLPVSDADHVGWAIYYSATAQQEKPVELYGKDDDRMIKPGQWNGRTILTLGETWTEVEEPLARLKPQWLGADNAILTRAQQALTDFR